MATWIERIRIKGYRSLADVEPRPDGVTVPISSNYSGKSTIVRSLDFISDIYRVGAKLVIEHQEGFDNIAERVVRLAGRQIEFEIEATSTYRDIFDSKHVISS